MMASRIGILLVAFLSYALVASPGQPNATNESYGGELDQETNHTRTTDQMSYGSEQMGNDSFVLRAKPFQSNYSSEQDDPSSEPAQSDSRPETMRKLAQAIQEPEPMPKPVQEPKPTQPGQEPQPMPNPGQEPVTKPVVDRPKVALRKDFYAKSCPNAERIVNATLHKHLQIDPSYAAGFARLFFHDCFVTGCDASILLDVTPSQDFVEKKASHNGATVRGYEVVDDIKLQLEAACPGIVSCADILAFVTRDGLVSAGVPHYDTGGGRRDAMASLADNVEANLPRPDTTADQNIELFLRKGLTIEDLVLLVGAHSIGSAHCNIVSGRFHNEEKAKEIDRGYLMKMQTMTICHFEDQDLPFDPNSPHTMDARFYEELLERRALIESDHNLARDPRTSVVMQKLVGDDKGWLKKFGESMKRLGEVDVLTGDEGEVRKNCRFVNPA